MLDGLDDGPPLPRLAINAWKRDQLTAEWIAGATLRSLASKYEVSHETARAWTQSNTRKGGASRRPHRSGAPS